MTKIVHPDLLSDIAAYCARQNMTRSAFGLAAVRDPRLVFDIEEGRELRSRTVERVRHFINTGDPLADGDAA
ncbi:MAG: hypothetical protein IPM60_15130 [Rhodospirillales bacterium]|nr:hypothetical protein [Rhodospirillales bacterium]